VDWYFQCVHDGQIDATLFLVSDEYVNFLNIRFPVFPTLIREIRFRYIKFACGVICVKIEFLGPFFLHPNLRHNMTPLLSPLRLYENLFLLFIFNTPHSKQFYAFWNAFVIDGVLNSSFPTESHNHITKYNLIKDHSTSS